MTETLHQGLSRTAVIPRPSDGALSFWSGGSADFSGLCLGWTIAQRKPGFQMFVRRNGPWWKRSIQIVLSNKSWFCIGSDPGSGSSDGRMREASVPKVPSHGPSKTEVVSEKTLIIMGSWDASFAGTNSSKETSPKARFCNGLGSDQGFVRVGQI